MTRRHTHTIKQWLEGAELEYCSAENDWNWQTMTDKCFTPMDCQHLKSKTKWRVKQTCPIEHAFIILAAKENFREFKEWEFFKEGWEAHKDYVLEGGK